MSEPDAENLLCDLLDDLGNHVGTWFPDSFDDAFPIIHVQRVGGPRSRNFDDPLIQVAVICPTRAASQSLMVQVTERILASPGTVVSGQLIDLARDRTGPQQVPYIDPDPRMVVRTFEFSWRLP